MKVKQLIEALKELDQDAPVFVRGYEGGVDDIYKIVEVKILRDENQYYDFSGRHEVCYDGEDGEFGYQIKG